MADSAAMQVRGLLSLCFYVFILAAAVAEAAADSTQKKAAAAAAAPSVAASKPAPAPSVSQAPSPKPGLPAPASSPKPSPEAAAPSSSPAAAAAAPAAAPATAPAVAPPPPALSNASLDPHQLAALRSFGVPIGRDVCAPNPDSPLVCDEASPSRHLVSLELRYCPAAAVLSTDALDSLAASLKSLAFLHCPMKAVPFPPEMTSSLESLSIVSSLGRETNSGDATTGEDPGTDTTAITGVWLGKFHGLDRLEVRDVVLNASGLPIVLANMTGIRELAITNASLGGRLPRSWPANLTTLDLSGNRIEGGLPSFFGQLRRLESMDLSGNNISGHLPESLGHLRSLERLVLSQNGLEGPLPQSLVNMTALSYLDLSGNRLNGSFPDGIADLSNLRYVDLRDNALHGMLPLNTSFLAGLNSFKVSGNPSLCYNKLLTSSRLAAGLAECDQFGNPIVPSTGGPAAASSGDGGFSSDSGGGQQHHGSSSSSSHKSSGGPKKIVWAVATALGAIFLFIAILVAVSKWCKYNKG